MPSTTVGSGATGSATGPTGSTTVRCRSEPGLRERSLRELVADSLEAGSIHYYEPYEEVHRHNTETVLS
jgi:hypothetical protein